MKENCISSASLWIRASALSYIQTIQMIFNDIRALYRLILCFHPVFSYTLSHFNLPATNTGLRSVPGRVKFYSRGRITTASRPQTGSSEKKWVKWCLNYNKCGFKCVESAAVKVNMMRGAFLAQQPAAPSGTLWSICWTFIVKQITDFLKGLLLWSSL